jgi:TonB family protein
LATPLNNSRMRAVALALAFFALAPMAWAQSGDPRPDSSSTVSTATPADLPNDETFSHFERVTTGIKPPKATHAPDPKFPDLPPDAEQHGIVVILVGLNTKGRVQALRVLRSDEKAFEQSAVETVKKWKFKPAEKNGQPVPVQVTVEMKFQR